MLKNSSKRIGLALGSGGARGWAHLGVFQALQERNIQISCVAGTSMGAVIGAFIAARRESVLRDLTQKLDWKRIRSFFWEVSLSRSGLTDGRKLTDEFTALLGVRDFRELEWPFRVVATDLNLGTEVVLSTGNLAQAVRASISIPGLFSPVKMGRRLLIDGGLVNPVPVNVVRAMGAQVVIAVDVSQGIAVEASPEENAPPKRTSRKNPLALPIPDATEEKEGVWGMLHEFRAEIETQINRLRTATSRVASMPVMTDVLVRSVRIAESQIALARRQIEPPDLLVEPAVGNMGTLEFHRAEEAIQAGYEAALKALVNL